MSPTMDETLVLESAQPEAFDKVVDAELNGQSWDAEPGRAPEPFVPLRSLRALCALQNLLFYSHLQRK